jgi:inorganic triphosphatase YgiF
VVRSEVRRTRWDVERDGTRIEVSLDFGQVRGANANSRSARSSSSCSTAILAAIFDLARDLGARVPLRLGVLSKAERGFALADGVADRVTQGTAAGARRKHERGRGVHRHRSVLPQALSAQTSR